MRRSLSWFDPQALAAALERAGVGQGPAVPSRRPSAPSRPQETPPEAAGPGEPFTAPEGNFAERLEAFCEWLSRTTGCKGIFVADRDGLPVLEKNTGEELIAASSLVARFLNLMHSRHPSVNDSGLALELQTGDRVYFLLDRSDPGGLCLGFVATAPLTRGLLERAQAAFSSALKETKP